MKFWVSRRTSATVLTLALATVGAAQAQEMDWRPFFSVTPVWPTARIRHLAKKRPRAAANKPFRAQSISSQISLRRQNHGFQGGS